SMPHYRDTSLSDGGTQNTSGTESSLNPESAW
ncbi:unnamed protein product, partial [marine sediment metagenome]